MGLAFFPWGFLILILGAYILGAFFFLNFGQLLDSKISNKNATNSPQTFLILVTNDKVHAEEGSLSTSPPATTLVLLVTAADLTTTEP